MEKFSINHQREVCCFTGKLSYCNFSKKIIFKLCKICCCVWKSFNNIFGLIWPNFRMEVCLWFFFFLWQFNHSSYRVSDIIPAKSSWSWFYRRLLDKSNYFLIQPDSYRSLSVIGVKSQYPNKLILKGLRDCDLASYYELTAASLR